MRRPRPLGAHTARGAGVGTVSLPPSVTSISTTSKRTFQRTRIVPSPRGDPCRSAFVKSSETTISASSMVSSRTPRSVRSSTIVRRTIGTESGVAGTRIISTWVRGSLVATGRL